MIEYKEISEYPIDDRINALIEKNNGNIIEVAREAVSWMANYNFIISRISKNYLGYDRVIKLEEEVIHLRRKIKEYLLLESQKQGNK